MISQPDPYSNPTHELWNLLEGLCEDRLTSDQFASLERMLVSDASARRIYRDYLDLHGSLFWDAATSEEPTDQAVADGEPVSPVTVTSNSRGFSKNRLLAIAAMIVLGVVGLWFAQREQPSTPNEEVATSPEKEIPGLAPAPRDLPLVPAPERDVRPVELRPVTPDGPAVVKKANEGKPDTVVSHDPPSEKPIDRLIPEKTGSPSTQVVAAINTEIRKGWDDAIVEPSPVASDSEWVRRVHLDLVGQIPTAETVKEFLADDDEDKREKLVNQLLADPAYVRHFATVWTNLLVGRSTERDVERVALNRYLRESFGRNRPWSEVVYDLVSAEGPAEENGASGFLLAHLNNEAVPATAITARLFLCMQVQCTQCHKHPHNEELQSQFWELNSFFQQTDIEKERVVDRQGKPRMLRSLVSRSQGGPTFYEDLKGVVQPAYPVFAGVAVSPAAHVNRRQQLAELMISGDSPQIAKALVNRLWAHFFGYGFTQPLDDMGPHNQATHPELLERLTTEFVAHGFNVKELIRWICLSDPYQRSSQFTDRNLQDNPSVGEPPLFSRMYVRSMTAEQLYDSLLVASKAHFASGSSWNEIQQQRQDWLQQFVTAFDTEENDEVTQFEGTVPQALLLMNSELVEQAVLPKQGTYFSEILHRPINEAEKIRELTLAALSRYPTQRELSAARKLLQARRKSSPNGHVEALQDVFWAYLNSSEFILVH